MSPPPGGPRTGHITPASPIVLASQSSHSPFYKMLIMREGSSPKDHNLANVQLFLELLIDKCISSLNCPPRYSSLKRFRLDPPCVFSSEGDLMLFNTPSFWILRSSYKCIKPKRKRHTQQASCQSGFFYGFYSWIYMTWYSGVKMLSKSAEGMYLNGRVPV